MGTCSVEKPCKCDSCSFCGAASKIIDTIREPAVIQGKLSLEEFRHELERNKSQGLAAKVEKLEEEKKNLEQENKVLKKKPDWLPTLKSGLLAFFVALFIETIVLIMLRHEIRYALDFWWFLVSVTTGVKAAASIRIVYKRTAAGLAAGVMVTILMLIGARVALQELATHGYAG